MAELQSTRKSRNQRGKKSGKRKGDPVLRWLMILAVALVLTSGIGVGGYFVVAALQRSVAGIQMDSAVGNLISAYQAYNDEIMKNLQQPPLELTPDPMKMLNPGPPNWEQIKAQGERLSASGNAASLVLKREEELFDLACKAPPTDDQVNSLITRYKAAADALAEKQAAYVKVATDHRHGRLESMGDIGRIRSYRQQTLTKWSAKFAEHPGSDRILRLFEAYDWQVDHPDRSAYAWLGKSAHPLILDSKGYFLKERADKLRNFAGDRFVQIVVECASEQDRSIQQERIVALFPTRTVDVQQGGFTHMNRAYNTVETTLYPAMSFEELKPYLTQYDVAKEIPESRALLLRPKLNAPQEVKPMPEPSTLPDDFVPFPGWDSGATIRPVITIRYESAAYPNGLPRERFQPLYSSTRDYAISSSWHAGNVYVQFGLAIVSYLERRTQPLPDFSQFTAVVASRTDLGTVTKTIPEKRVIHFRLKGEFNDLVPVRDPSATRQP